MKPKANINQVKPTPKPNPKQATSKPVKEATPKIQEDPALQKIKVSRVKTICSIVVIGLIASLLYHYCQAHVFGKDFYPYNTFLFNPGDRFNDFNNQFRFALDLDPYSYPTNYFPLAYIFLHAFSIFPIETALLVFTASFVIFFLIYLYKNIPAVKGFNKLLAVFILSVMTYPFLFVADRGNVEVWLFMSLAMFIYFYLKGNDLLSIIFLSIAISLKLYPGIFLVLFVFDKKYLTVVYTGIVTLVMSVISAALLKGGVMDTINGLMTGLSNFSRDYITGSSSSILQHNISFFVPLKLIYYNVLSKSESFPPHYETVFNKYYVMFTFCFFLVIAFVMLRYKMSFWKRIALMILISIALQQSSYDYKLINLFIPLILFLNSEERPKFNVAYAVIFGLLLIPKDYFIIVDDLSIATIINPILILSMIILIVYEAIKSGEKIDFSFYWKLKS